MPKKYYDEDGNEVFLTEKNDAPSAEEGLKGCGNAMSGCGCLMTLFITIPLLLLLL